MKFSEKLNYLMNITNTSNSTLAKAIPLDPSFVSRLRNGIRTPAKNENYIEKIAEFFSEKIQYDYQKSALCEILDISISSFPDNEERVNIILWEWLQKEQTNKIESVGQFLSDISDFSFQSMNKNVNLSHDNTANSDVIEANVQYGLKGRQDLVMSFLEELTKNNTPDTIYGFNEDSISWLYDDDEYRELFQYMLINTLNKGNRFKVIHTFKRTLNEMFSLIETWLPIYLTGYCEPYYYPKMRDGLMKNTLLLAPKTAAMYSFTCGCNDDNTFNILIKDKRLIHQYSEEFNKYLNQCNPLIKIFSDSTNGIQYGALKEFDSIGENSIHKNNMFSSFTIPKSTLKRMLHRTNETHAREIMDSYSASNDNFIKQLEQYSYTDTITLPPIEQINDNNVIYYCYYSNGYFETNYTKKEFIEHIKMVIHYLKAYDNYNLVIIPTYSIPNCIIHAKKDVGVLLAKESDPQIMLAINEKTMSNAVWEYMSFKTNITQTTASSKLNTIEYLEKLITKIN